MPRTPGVAVALILVSFVAFCYAAPPYPSDLLPCVTEWKITLPVDHNGDDSSNETDVDQRNTDAMEVVGEDLIDYKYSPYFYAADSEVVFRAHCAGATTSGSKYPRSELRQLVDGGSNYWSMNDPQFLQASLRVTHVPVEKPEVCMVQIHGPDDEPLRVQYHADRGVYLIWNESNKDYDNALDYTLGERLEVTVSVQSMDITCTIRNLDRGAACTKTWTSMDATGYFKVGCYTQSSIFLSQFKTGKNDEPLDAYGEVRVSALSLTPESVGVGGAPDMSRVRLARDRLMHGRGVVPVDLRGQAVATPRSGCQAAGLRLFPGRKDGETVSLSVGH
ncbi:MAG: hypothetical protein GF331_17005 [Chitinivibrionales bacterium]|nr:hypothetical protein [Chitinivibrionales bacterium]